MVGRKAEKAGGKGRRGPLPERRSGRGELVRPRLAGMGVASALGPDLAAFEEGLRQGRSGIGGRMQGWPVGRLGGWDARDHGAGTLPVELAARVVGQALEAAGETPEVLADPGTVLVVASTKGDIAGLAGGAGGQVCLGPFLGRVRARLGHGPGHAELVSCACASGGAALARAATLLGAGAGQRAIVVGVDVLDPFLLAGFGALGALSTLPCRPFDRDRDGMSLGEGAAAVLLTLDDRPGVRLVGSGLSCDATSLLRPREDGSGLALAIGRALDEAGGDRDVDAICGHGTGTIANDAMEMAAVRSALGRGGSSPPLFGIKGATGHTLGACGVMEAVACALALRGGFLPGTVGFGTAEGKAGSGLDIVATTRPVAGLRRLLSTNAGFGGVNVALVLDADS